MCMVFFFLSSCVSIKEKKIIDYNIIENKKIVNIPKNNLWDKVVEKISEMFFSIDQIDKATGFINISFYTDNINYINCNDNHINFGDGIRGTINIFISEIDLNTSKISINIKYIFRYQFGNNYQTDILYTNKCFKNNIPFSNYIRVCCPTSLFEKELFEKFGIESKFTKVNDNKNVIKKKLINIDRDIYIK